ncbi:unnamed protein product [Parajaminaea phylloscopi]
MYGTTTFWVSAQPPRRGAKHRPAPGLRRAGGESGGGSTGLQAETRRQPPLPPLLCVAIAVQSIGARSCSIKGQTIPSKLPSRDRLAYEYSPRLASPASSARIRRIPLPTMSVRDRFFSQLSSAQDQIYNHIDSFQRQHISDSAQPGASTSQTQLHPDLDRRGTLPRYAPAQPSGAPSVPAAVLAARPGRAQEVYDSMPRSRLENTSAPTHERRRAADEMRKEQAMLHKTGPVTPEQQAAGLKKIHSYAASSGKVVVDIHTLPQRSPTFMGGSQERGRGALQGQVIVFAQGVERVNAVRLKVKAVSHIAMPRAHLPPSAEPHLHAGASAASSRPALLGGRSPGTEATIPREHLILQLEKTLWSPDSRDTSMVFTPPSGSNQREDATVWNAGRHVFPFKVDLPAVGKDGQDLPPSFVFLADSTASKDAVKQAQVSGALSSARRWVEQAGGSGNQGEWASVKWYVKVTVERPGLFNANERIFAPFVYLPPPPKKCQHAILPTRMKMNQQLREDPTTPGNRLAEPIGQWDSVSIDLDATATGSGKGKGKGKAPQRQSTRAAAPAGSSGMWSRLFKGPVLAAGAEGNGQPRWILRYPNQPAIWPLKSCMPFELRAEGGQGSLTPPLVGLFLRITLTNAGKSLLSSKTSPMSATETRQMATAKLFGSRTANSSSGSSQVWRGVLEFPPQATPDFASPYIETEYFVAVQKAPGARVAWAQKVLLVCSMPVIVKTPRRPTGAGASTAGTVRGVRRASSSRRRTGVLRTNAPATSQSQQTRPTKSPPSLKQSTPVRTAALAQDVRADQRAPESSTAANVGSTPVSNERRRVRRTNGQHSGSGGGPLDSSPSPSRAGTPVLARPELANESRRPSAGSRRGSGYAASPLVQDTGASDPYPPEKVPAPEPRTSRNARREHEMAEAGVGQSSTSSGAGRTPAQGTPSASRRSSYVASEISARSGEDSANWEFEDRGGEGSNVGDEGLEDMGMDLPPSYWEATAEIRDGN